MLLDNKVSLSDSSETFFCLTKPLHEVLACDAVSSYLTRIQAPLLSHTAKSAALCATVQTVLDYVHSNQLELFGVVLGLPLSASVSRTEKLYPKDGICADSAIGSINGSGVGRQNRASSSSFADAAMVQEDATSPSASGEAAAANLNGSSPHATTEENDLEELFVMNTAELFSFCIAQSSVQSDVDDIVVTCIKALSLPATLKPYRAVAVQRLLLEAFDKDFETTTSIIASTLSQDVITGVVQNLASNSTIAETLIALFGSAVSAVWMMKPTTKTSTFTSRWIELNFPQEFSAYLQTAIADPSKYHYFYFFRELLKRGYSQSAGPVVDILLTEEVSASYIEAVLCNCEQNIGCSPLYSLEGAAALVPSLAADGVDVLTSIVALLRKSLVIPESAAMYYTTTAYISSVASIQRHAPRFVALLEVTEDELQQASYSCTTSAVGVARLAALGTLRLAVCELFVELSCFQYAGTDETVISSQFFPAFLRCCAAFPEHDALIRLLHRCLLTLFQRPLFAGETVEAMLARDRLWAYCVDPNVITTTNRSTDSCNHRSNECHAVAENAENASDVAFSTTGHTSVIGRVMEFAKGPSNTLSSHAIDLLHRLSLLPTFANGRPGPLQAVLQEFQSTAAVQVRLEKMSSAITGAHFILRGSSGAGKRVHRVTINLAGDRFRSVEASQLGQRRSSSSSSSGGGSGGRATGGGGDYYSVLHHSPDDGALQRPRRASLEVVVDMAALKKEMQDLQEAGSPQMQSYPSFGSMKLSFLGTGTNA